MKNLYTFNCILFVVIFSACGKDVKTSNNDQNEPNNPAPPTPESLQWQKPYGSSSDELGFAITAANDGDYVFAGYTIGNDGDVSGYHGGTGSDAWIVKINNSGSIVWQKCFGGSNSDMAFDIITTTDGGYVFIGVTQSNDGDVPGNRESEDVWIVKLDTSGTIVWQKRLGGSAHDVTSLHANSILQTADGGFLVAATTSSIDGDASGNHGGSDAWIIKLSNGGSLVWEKTYGGSLNDGANSIISTADGNYMVSGYAMSTDGDLSGQVNQGGKDCWLFKINDNGNILWQKTYGGSQNEDASNVRSTADGGYVFSSVTASNDGDVSGNHGTSDTWVVKINKDGNISWQKCFGGADVDNAAIRDIDSEGKILLIGNTFSGNGDITDGYPGTEDLWILRLDANGNKLNSNALGGTSDDTGEDAIAIADGIYMGIGRTGSNDGKVKGNHGGEDIWVVKFKF
jgi:hypothetical protein